MIIFYDKAGKIVGTVEGRIHSEEHLKMWIGNKNEIKRIVLDWESVEVGEDETEEKKMVEVGKDKKGEVLYKQKIVKKKIPKREWQPKKYPKFTKKIDKGKENIRDYKVDLDKKGKIKGFIKK